MKKIKYILLILVLLCFNSAVKADIQSGSSGGSGITGDFIAGQWNDKAVGIKVSILDSNNNIRDVEILVNSSGTLGASFSSSNLPKTHQSNQIKWSTNATVYNIGSLLPSSWYSSGKFVDLNNHLDNDSKLGNLKKILNYKYNNTMIFLNGKGVEGLAPGDYILIEPMVKISGYYGTAYEFLHAKNVTYSSSNSGCGNNDFCKHYIGSVFAGISYVDNAPIIWNTLYAEERWGGITELKDYQVNGNTTLTAERINCLKSQTCGRGIGVFKYDDIFPGGYLEIYKKRSDTNQLITSSPAKFSVYNNTDCSGPAIQTSSTGYSGVAKFSLSPGTYSYKETTTPHMYKGDNNCYSVTITTGATIEKTINNSPTCELELSEKPKTPGNLLILYKKYGHKGLLNFSNPSCSDITESTCPSTVNGLDKDCLIASTDNTNNFNSYNLSCFDIELNDENGNPVAFCKDAFTFNHNMSATGLNQNEFNNFYSSAGRFLIKQYSTDAGTNVLKGFIKKGDNKIEFSTNDLYLAYAKLQRTCYVLNGKTIYDSTLKSSKSELNVKFADNDSNNVADKLEYDILTNPYTGDEDLIPDAAVSNITYFTKKTFNEYRAYRLNKIYIEKISGKISSSPDAFEHKIEAYGVVSKLNATSGNLPFYIKYKKHELGKEKEIEINSKKCNYEVEKGIVNTPDSDPEDNPTPGEDSPSHGSLLLEFRLVDTTNPFPNRKPNSNWRLDIDNFGFDNEEYTNIINSDDFKFFKQEFPDIPEESLWAHYIFWSTNNSYDKKGVGPIYKITLTPSDIKTIREYNDSVPYDSYKLKCDLNGNNCMNAFVKNLVGGYLNDKPISKLIISGS